MTWRSKVALPASWDGHVDALEKHVFCIISAWFLISMVFQTLFLRWLETPRGSSGFDSQGLDVDIVSIYETPENRHGNGNSHSSNGWVYRGFPVVILVVVFIFH